MDFDARVRTAHGDAWQVIGDVHRPAGDGTATLPGVRLVATGLPHPQWNTGDVDDPDAVDIDQVTSWYAERSVPWGLLLPAGAAWGHGRMVLRLRLMGLRAAGFVPEVMDGLELRVAGPADLEHVLAVDSIAFDSDLEASRPWIAPHLGVARIETVLAVLGGRPVGTAYCVRSVGRAGSTAFLAGVGVVPEARGRGVGGALSSWLIGRAIDDGYPFVHLSPVDDRAAALYSRLGFVEAAGLDAYVHCEG